MSHVKRLKVVTTAERIAAVWPDGEPLVDSDRRAAGYPFYFIGDAATTGALLVAPIDNVVEIPWTGHGRTLPATGIDSVVSDGTTLTDAQALATSLPSFHIVGVPDANTLRIITSGIAWLPNTSLVAGQAYWLGDATANTLVTTEPNVSVPVCEVLSKTGTGAWVRFMDWRPWQRELVSATHWRLNITDTHGKNTGFVLNDVCAIDEIEFRASVGVAEVMPSANVFFSSEHSAPFAAVHAFDGSISPSALTNNTTWHTPAAATFPHQIGTSFAASRVVVELMLRGSQHVNHGPLMPRDFDLQLSTDNGATWKTRREYRGLSWVDGEVKLLAV